VIELSRNHNFLDFQKYLRPREQCVATSTILLSSSKSLGFHLKYVNLECVEVNTEKKKNTEEWNKNILIILKGKLMVFKKSYPLSYLILNR